MEIRNISLYNRTIKNRYYASTDGSVYTKCKDRRVAINGTRRTVTRHIIKEAIASSEEFIIPFKDWGLNCIVLSDGTVLRRLKTFVKECNSVTVCLFSVLNKELRLYVSRVIANTFIEDVTNKEVHHIDQNRLNNSVENLKVMTFQEHRGKNNFKLNHTIKCND